METNNEAGVGEAVAEPVTKEVVLRAELMKLRGFKSAAANELLAAGPGSTDLINEMRVIEDRIREVNVQLFLLGNAIQKGVGKRQVKCPCCERFVPQGHIAPKM